MMGYGGYGTMVGFGGLGMIVSLLFWVGLVVLGVWAAARLLPSQRASGQDTAMDVLKRRYAGGEISAAEYQQTRRDLTGPEDR